MTTSMLWSALAQVAGTAGRRAGNDAWLWIVLAAVVIAFIAWGGYARRRGTGAGGMFNRRTRV